MSFELYIPRFIHGDGSLIRVDISSNPELTVQSDRYVAYVTYDQGSFKKAVVPGVQQTTEELFITFWNMYGEFIGFLTGATIAGFVGLIFNNIVKKRRPPHVVRVFPEDRSEGVSFNPLISATFNKPIDSSTVNINTFFLKVNNYSNVEGVVSILHDNKTVIFRPLYSLMPCTAYVATISGIKGLGSKKVNEDRIWSFATICPK